jgi:hypothetical protein
MLNARVDLIQINPAMTTITPINPAMTTIALINPAYLATITQTTAIGLINPVILETKIPALGITNLGNLAT